MGLPLRLPALPPRIVLPLLFILFTGFADPSYEQLCQQGRQHLAQEEYREAIATFTRAIEQQPDKAVAYVGRALAHQAEEDYEAVIADAIVAIDNDERQTLAYVLRADAYMKTDRTEAAIEQYTQAIELDAERSSAYSGRAKAYHTTKDHDRALRDYSKAIRLDPKNLEAYLGRAQVNQDRGEPRQAMDDYSHLIGQAEDPAPYLFLRARIYYDREDFKRAIDDCSEAIRRDPGFAAAYGLRGAVYYATEEYQSALDDLDEAVRLAPVDPGAYLWLGRTQLALGKTKEAIQNLSDAIELDAQYAPALKARSKAYDKAEQPELAQADRDTLRAIEAEREASAASGRLAAAIRRGEVPELLVERLAAASTKLEERPDPSSLLADTVRAEAIKERTLTLKVAQVLEACDAASVVPDPCRAADEAFENANALLEDGQFEIAASGFRFAGKRYGEAIAAFEFAAASDYALWVGWAEKKTEREVASENRVLVWMALAEVYHQLSDQDGYGRAIGKVRSQVKGLGIANPMTGAGRMLQIAELQTRCNDGNGAKISAADAAVFCEGLQDAATKSISLARCAGYFGQLQDAAGWARYVRTAMETAKQTGYPNRRERRLQPLVTLSTAYAEAYDSGSAMETVQELLAQTDPPSSHDWAAPCYARIARCASLAISKGYQQEPEFQKSYTATCGHLASLLMPHYGVGPFGRNALARGDADVGAFDRAMVGALNVADPTARASALALILRRAVERDDLDWAELARDHLRERSETTDGARWMAELKLKQNKPSMVSLKQWAESLRPSSESAMALAGIAVGLQKRGDPSEESTSSDETDDARGGLVHERPNSIEQFRAFAEQGDHLAAAEVFASLLHEHRKNSQVREIFDRSAASVPRWWMEQALALTDEVEDPLLQATMWRQLAVAQKDLGDENGVGPALKRSIFAIMACWCELDKKRGQAQRSYKGTYQWDEDSRTERAQVAAINGILAELLEIEDLQHQEGQSEASLNTLLLALKCVEVMPRNSTYAGAATPQSLCGWMARLGGRLRLRGRKDLADLILAQLPWAEPNLVSGDENYLHGLAAAEIGDLAVLQKLASEMRSEAVRTRSGQRAGYAATLYGLIAQVAAEQGDDQLYQGAAVTLGGLVNAARQPAPQERLALLAQAAAIRGELDLAEQFLEQSQAKGAQRDEVLAQILTERLKAGQIVKARSTLEMISEDRYRIPARYALVKVEVSAPSARLSVIFEDIENQASMAEKAASMAAVATVLLAK